MKIRTDFVTNSGSVSYILTMNEDMVKLHLKNYKGMFKNGADIIAEIIRKFMIEQGTRVYLENEEIHTYKFSFNTGDTLDESSLDLAPEQMDFGSMNDDELWAYIYGEYILNGKITSIWGFGITQTGTN